jgi:hypothetical protein
MKSDLRSSFAPPQTKCVWDFAAGDGSVMLEARARNSEHHLAEARDSNQMRSAAY